MSLMLAKDDDDGFPAGCPFSLFLAVPASKSAWEKMLKFWLFYSLYREVSVCFQGLEIVLKVHIGIL